MRAKRRSSDWPAELAEFVSQDWYSDDDVDLSAKQREWEARLRWSRARTHYAGDRADDPTWADRMIAEINGPPGPGSVHYQCPGPGTWLDHEDCPEGGRQHRMPDFAIHPSAYA